MGAKIIFKNADFQQNALIDNITDITSSVTWSAKNWQYNDSSTISNSYQNVASLSGTRKIGSIDVSEYIGRKIKLIVSCPSQWVEDTHSVRIAFASAMKSLPSSTSGSNIGSALTVVEGVKNLEPVYTGAKTFLLTVPEGAVYLVFSHNSDVCEAKVGLIGE